MPGDTPGKLDRLIQIVKTLRAPGGCPWDREQTFKSLKPLIIEEAYELIQAIDDEHMADLKEELGDILLHIVMISEMADEQQAFGLEDVIETISEKMIRRHPHVFGDRKVKSVEEVWTQWETIKKKEKKQSLLASVPSQLPALLKAAKIQKRAAKAGMDFTALEDIFPKLEEELQEFKAACQNEDRDAQVEEMGDLLFSIVNCIRKLGIDPEAALQTSNKKFIHRITAMETQLETAGQTWSDKTPDELEILWNRAKS